MLQKVKNIIWDWTNKILLNHLNKVKTHLFRWCCHPFAILSIVCFSVVSPNKFPIKLKFIFMYLYIITYIYNICICWAEMKLTCFFPEELCDFSLRWPTRTELYQDKAAEKRAQVTGRRLTSWTSFTCGEKRQGRKIPVQVKVLHPNMCFWFMITHSLHIFNLQSS